MNSAFLRPINRQRLRTTFAKVNWTTKGKVTNVVGTVVEAYLPGIRLGALVDITVHRGSESLLAEVVGFRDERVLLLPYGELNGIAPGSEISRHATVDRIAVGAQMLGHVFDPFLDCMTNPEFSSELLTGLVSVDKSAPNPVARQRISDVLPLGIKAIDAALTFGGGQRLGIMAGSGVGKSVLMGMIARGTTADINVIGLIGERGREVREFLEKDLGPEGLARSIVICVTSDQSPLMKVRAAKVVHAIAEFFSSVGNRVLIMLDSLTRVAMAQREIGLAIGEPPTTKGYTPSVFSLLPKLLERSGPQPEPGGSISALYTVLVDADDFNDPIADSARSILDGHINLSRQLAAKGQFPAIDISSSISRIMSDVTTEKHQQIAMYLRKLIGVYQENIDMVQIGAYQPGTNPDLDEALRLMPDIYAFLRQGVDERSDFESTLTNLEQLLTTTPPSETS